MVSIRVLLSVAALAATAPLAGCLGGGDVGVSRGSQPRLANWTCTKGVELTIRRTGAGIEVADSRGFTVALLPDPPGQRERYAKAGYALVFAGRTASWFAHGSGAAPTDCRR